MSRSTAMVTVRFLAMSRSTAMVTVRFLAMSRSTAMVTVRFLAMSRSTVTVRFLSMKWIDDGVWCFNAQFSFTDINKVLSLLKLKSQTTAKDPAKPPIVPPPQGNQSGNGFSLCSYVEWQCLYTCCRMTITAVVGFCLRRPLCNPNLDR